MSDEHGYTWADVRERPADELGVGETWVNPGAFTAYWTDRDGNVRPVSLAPLDGTAWTVLARDGGYTTAVSHDGRELTCETPPGQRVLAVQTKEARK